MKRFSLLACTAAALLLTAACKKDQLAPQSTTGTPTSTPTPTPSPDQELTGKTWLMTGATVDPGLQTSNGTTVTNIYPFVPSCTKDDTQQFLTGGVYKSDEGATKCDPQDPQTTTGNWAMAQSGSDTTLKITVNGGTLHLKVVSLTATQLQVTTQDDVFGLGTTANTYTLTYTKN